jgi:hypothetical protein
MMLGITGAVPTEAGAEGVEQAERKSKRRRQERNLYIWN